MKAVWLKTVLAVNGVCAPPLTASAQKVSVDYDAATERLLWRGFA